MYVCMYTYVYTHIDTHRHRHIDRPDWMPWGDRTKAPGNSLRHTTTSSDASCAMSVFVCSCVHTYTGKERAGRWGVRDRTCADGTDAQL